MASMQRLLALLALMALPWQTLAEETYDPFETVNRKIYAFNEVADRYVLRPVARGYLAVTPDPVERGVSNFIRNVFEFNTITNSVLQWRLADSAHSTGRFVINTTLGLGGLFDVATRLGLEHRPADFGQTLAIWGLGKGPFLMVPILGPRTLRSGTGTLVDTYTSLPFLSGEGELMSGVTAIQTIDIRAELLKADELIVGDPYIFLREAYMQRRDYFLTGKIDDTFSDYEDEEDYEDF